MCMYIDGGDIIWYPMVGLTFGSRQDFERLFDEYCAREGFAFRRIRTLNGGLKRNVAVVVLSLSLYEHQLIKITLH